MLERKIGRVDDKNTVHFCGVLDTGGANPCVFLPRKAKSDLYTENRKLAKLTMRCLSKYGKQHRYEGVSGLDNGNTGMLALIKDLADDFLEYGIFQERTRFRSKESGKPDWPNTIKRETPFFSNSGAPVYSIIRTSRTRDSSDSLLAQVQSFVLEEIEQRHGWWIDGLSSSRLLLDQHPKPASRKSSWVIRLQALLPELFLKGPFA